MGCDHTTALASGHCDSCDPLERVRYFPRQLLTADDMRAEQDYFREKLRRHNRMLFGRGVACGLQVQPKDAADKTSSIMVVCPGYALSPAGDDIFVPKPVEFDLSRCMKPAIADCMPAGVTVSDQGDRTCYVAIQPLDCPSRPVRTLPEGCGCDETACEFARVREGYEIKCLTSLPGSHGIACPPLGQGAAGTNFMKAALLHMGAMGATNPEAESAAQPLSPKIGGSALNADFASPFAQLFEALLGQCALCPEDSWVVLAAVTVTSAGSVSIDNGVRRRIVNLSTLVERLACLTAK
jgi:hypothetical protein